MTSKDKRHKLYHNILLLAELKKQSLRQFCDSCDISHSSVCFLVSKTRTIETLSIQSLEKICTYVNLTIDELRLGTPTIIKKRYKERESWKFLDYFELVKRVGTVHN